MTRLAAPLRRNVASVMTHSAITTPSPTKASAVAAGCPWSRTSRNARGRGTRARIAGAEPRRLSVMPAR